MKRALAERAKQSGLPNGVGPASPAAEKKISNSEPLPNTTGSSRTSTSGPRSPSSGISKTTSSSQQSLKNSRGSSTSTPKSSSSSSSPRPKKRLRESGVKLEEEDEDDANASAFYLRHQNRALASELRTLKYQLSRVERERDYRRTQCSKAVQSLNALQATWTQMESALQFCQPPPSISSDSPATSNAAATSSMEAPVSTGSGKSVELIGSLLDSLAALGTTTPRKKRGRIRGDDDDDDDEMDASSSSGENEDNYRNGGTNTNPEEPLDGVHTQQLDDLLRITDNVAKRAATLQRWIWSLLEKVDTGSPASGLEMAAQEQVVRLKSKNKSLKAKLKEMARSRDEMTESDKRVRRGLYRLAAGRVKLKEVLKAIVTSDEDKEAAAAWMEVQPTPVEVISKAAAVKAAAEAKVKTEGGATQSAEDAAQVAQLKKQVADLEQVASVRDEQIKKLLSEREEQIKRINGLVLKQEPKTTNVPSDQEVQRSDLYAQLTAKVSTNERLVKEKDERMEKMKEEWSKALADAELARTTMEEMQSKHAKRWAEFSKNDSDTSKKDASEGGDQKASSKKTSNAEEVARLEHKLRQALENVRQAETTRKTLTEAISMNESLQAKLDEIKTKYAALQAGRASNSSSSNSNHVSSSGTSSSSGSTTPKSKSSSSSASASSQSAEKPERSEKYRRMKKELAAATASKEAAKAKLERTEKERDSLNQTNSRLLRQAVEKDEMNAKSLSTILHLKQLTDQVTKEKENLELQVKSNQQLTVVSRLASNARERLSEEFEKELKSLKTQAMEKDSLCENLKEEKSIAEGKLNQQKAKMSALMKDVSKAKDRCEELAAESTKLHEENKKMMESLAVAQRESAEAVKVSEKLARQSGGGGLPSGFTAEQLNTQVSVLKSRLACPVCNHRDKKCILLRCRHMFCRQCVDENIKNRSRKCPACGGRFDTKDVADVWL